jgi:hypothetical protein
MSQNHLNLENQLGLRYASLCLQTRLPWCPGVASLIVCSGLVHTLLPLREDGNGVVVEELCVCAPTAMRTYIQRVTEARLEVRKGGNDCMKHGFSWNVEIFPKGMNFSCTLRPITYTTKARTCSSDTER